MKPTTLLKAISSSFTRAVWKNLAGVAIALSIVSVASGAIAQVYQLDDSGPEVEEIQGALGITVDGVYGVDTESAVYQFQQQQGLQCVDGVAGPETLQALGLPNLVDSSLPCHSSSQSQPYYPSNSNVAQRCNDAPAAYVVVVPGANRSLFSQVQDIAPNACQDRSHLGSFIRADSFSQRSSAESLSKNLRRNGFDARVAYRP